MITISLLNYATGLPLQGRSVQLIFTDTVFGWIRPRATDESGVTKVETSPGPARVYVEGEFWGEYWLQEEMELSLKEVENPEPVAEMNDLVEASTQEQESLTEQGTPTSLLTVESGKEVRA
jgi:hypothetical protein